LVIELCGELGIPADEPALPAEAVATADEAFLTSSTREVQAISGVDGVTLPAAPGPVSRRLAAAFTDLVARDSDP
ncbi:MAG: 4-amino-4-deoxychorismate lyase, partial [Acidimicrobiia bacterium]|nr:4-amino-4-deoxychorismate lyase [Acidimicrobiia bacterium]